MKGKAENSSSVDARGWNRTGNNLYQNEFWRKRGLMVISNDEELNEKASPERLQVSQRRILEVHHFTENEDDAGEKLASSEQKKGKEEKLRKDRDDAVSLLQTVVDYSHLHDAACTSFIRSDTALVSAHKNQNELYFPFYLENRQGNTDSSSSSSPGSQIGSIDSGGFRLLPDELSCPDRVSDAESSASNSERASARTSATDLSLGDPAEICAYFSEGDSQDNIFLATEAEQTNINFYISPGLSDPVNDNRPGNFVEEFNGFKKYVVVGCIFGSVLQGVDKKGAMFTLIKHKIDFVEGEKIKGLTLLDDRLYPYERFQFSFMRELISFINATKQKDCEPEVCYHLPGIDYVLSVIKLYIQNKLEYKLLNQFLSILKKRLEMYIDKFEEIFNSAGISKITFESPFCNLLQNLMELESVDEFLALLELPINQPRIFNQKEVEKNLVDRILYLSIANNYNSKYRAAWEDILKINEGANKISTLERLFKKANGLVIAATSKNAKNDEVCSILPANEKPIFLEYARNVDALAKKGIRYPRVVSLVFLERLICYSQFAPGNSFYFHPHESALNKMIKRGALNEVARKKGFFKHNHPPKVRECGAEKLDEKSKGKEQRDELRDSVRDVSTSKLFK